MQVIAIFLVIILIGIIVHDVVEPKFVYALGCRNDAKPVSKLLLLEVLFGEVFQVASRKRLVRHDFQLPISLLADDDILSQIPSTTINLDSVMEELLESRNIKDLVIDRLRAIDDKLLGDLLTLLGR